MRLSASACGVFKVSFSVDWPDEYDESSDELGVVGKSTLIAAIASFID